MIGDAGPCPVCGEESGILVSFENLGDDNCAACGATICLEYDESYDPESGEERGYFHFTKVTDRAKPVQPGKTNT